MLVGNIIMICCKINDLSFIDFNVIKNVISNVLIGRDVDILWYNMLITVVREVVLLNIELKYQMVQNVHVTEMHILSLKFLLCHSIFHDVEYYFRTL